jgi:hypothetical protein
MRVRRAFFRFAATVPNIGLSLHRHKGLAESAARGGVRQQNRRDMISVLAPPNKRC